MTFYIVLSIIHLYLWFRSAMWYLRHKHELREKTGLAYFVFVLFLIPGLVLDVIVSWTIGIPLLGLIWKATVSEKLKVIRSVKWHGPTWRLRFADYVCETWLNPWDPDKHHC